jgi:hypothetical protein
MVFTAGLDSLPTAFSDSRTPLCPASGLSARFG